jgi:hypothetical protein
MHKAYLLINIKNTAIKNEMIIISWIATNGIKLSKICNLENIPDIVSRIDEARKSSVGACANDFFQ